MLFLCFQRVWRKKVNKK
uniref:Uncharacterized protein n=1 Tax=Rhizophora mucronata TaxID=61149 RepID=A0A2P2NWY9_RHIMU